MLIRTQVMLDSETKRDLKHIATYKKKSVSNLIREYLRDRLEKEREAKMSARSGKQVLSWAAKNAKSTSKNKKSN